jgi:serine/threonine protein phosphatase 1
MIAHWRAGHGARTARVPPGRRVYAVGDIHGCDDVLDQLLRMIRADAAGAGAECVAVFLGDYVDRGPMSFEVIDRLVNEPLPGFQHVFLKGNHEAMMLDFLAGPPDPLWLYNGGVETLMSYGIGGLWAFADTASLEAARRELDAALPPRHRAFLQGLRASHVEGDYAFVHAGIRPGVAFCDQREQDLLWIRAPFLASREPFDYRVVHGHTIVKRPEVLPHRIAIDTGAFHTGTLTCAVLEGENVRFLST